MAEPSRTDLNLATHRGDRLIEDPVLTTGIEPLFELPETSAVAAPGRSSNAQLNRSAEAVGRGVGNAVAGVKRLPRQFDRLRSRIHLVSPDTSAEASVRTSEVIGEWRDAVESGASELSAAATRYRSVFADRGSQRMRDLKWRAERRLFALRRDLRHRMDKVRRMASEEPMRFIVGCAGAGFAIGVALRVWRSNHE